MKSKNKSKKGNMILNLVFIVGAALGLAAFILHFTDKDCSEGFPSLKQEEEEERKLGGSPVRFGMPCAQLNQGCKLADGRELNTKYANGGIGDRCVYYDGLNSGIYECVYDSSFPKEGSKSWKRRQGVSTCAGPNRGCKWSPDNVFKGARDIQDKEARGPPMDDDNYQLKTIMKDYGPSSMSDGAQKGQYCFYQHTETPREYQCVDDGNQGKWWYPVD